MREILFRGKHINGEWIEGSLLIDEWKNYYIGRAIMPKLSEAYCVTPSKRTGKTINRFVGVGFDLVIPETVGQYTGRTDRNDKRIFEGDIVTGLFLFGLSVNAVVTFKDGAYGLEWYRGDIKTFDAFTSICNVEYEVIGNIHDNPELLKGAENEKQKLSLS